MGLNCGIVGLPNVGKSTIFTALTSASAEAANYPFCTIEPNVGVIEVPDERLGFLKTIYPTGKFIPALVEFVDIAGLVKGASQGAGLGNQFLSHIREVDALVQVVRCFDSSDVIHVEGSVSPVRDIETINAELAIADLDSVEKRILRVKKKAKANSKEATQEMEILNRLQIMLDDGKWLYQQVIDSFSTEEIKIITSFHLLTTKPMIYLGNISEDSSDNTHLPELEEYCKKEGFKCLSICGKIEEEISELEDEEKKSFLEELGISLSGTDKLIRLAYETLGLITFLTAGPKELRAWTIRNGALAPEAAGAIHSDFERGFIRAELIAFEDLKNAGDFQKAKASGLLRSEGKEYKIIDGDVINFRFNV